MHQNIDTHELDKFARQAPYWWDPDGPLKSLHDINPLRLQFIREKLDLSKTLDIIDIGCGGGILTESLATINNTRVIGLDANKALIDIATLHAAEKNIPVTYVTSTLEDFYHQYPHRQFDVITCMEMLEHVPNPAELIKTASRLLKPQGKIFFSTINRTPQAFLYALVMAEHILKLLPKGTHEYKKFIQPAELQQWCLDAHIHYKTMSGMGYNPLTKNYYLTNTIKVNYLVYAERDSF